MTSSSAALPPYRVEVMARTPGQQAWFDRHEVVATWVTKEDFAELHSQARAAGLTISTFAREILLERMKANRAAAKNIQQDGDSK